ncbi:allantoinase AllB [Paenibacillus piri]|uniref:Allantoinase n=1 Tax=Paenibacillus piri TaxID=2547395 RepID=A0A4R5KZN7_9BACL|nr:allantoinase AllB [Paenibacillus piri]TDG00551.1 allantoinase AllB [Paenibacillus piri]
MLDLKITGGHVVLRGEVLRLDIGVKDGTVVRLEESLADEAAERHYEAAGKHVLPGMIDAHVHFNEPAMGHWEGFATGSAALAAGGCTSYMDMPLNGLPPTVSITALKRKLEAAEGRSRVDYALWGGLVPGNADQLAPLAEAGVIGFKAFMSEPGGEGEDRFQRVDDEALLEGMKRIAKLNRVLALHAEDEAMTVRLARQAAAEGLTGALDYAASRPIAAECEAVRRALLMAERTGCPLHFVHISSAAAVELIQAAKDRGLDVTLETCPHYLTLTEADTVSLGAVAKCAPPLRSAEERDKLWQALADGRIDLIASDHSPSPPELKRADRFFDAWGGIAGAQSTFELMIGEGHLKRGLSLPFLCSLLSLRPAERFGLHPRKGEIALQADADFAIIDLNRPYKLSAEHLKQRHAYSPYTGRIMGCRVSATVLRGNFVYLYNSDDARTDDYSAASADDSMKGDGKWLRYRY